MNVELLERVKAHILEDPRRLDMELWIQDKMYGPDSPPCGTVGCIAGWAVELTEGGAAHFRSSYITEEARKLLDLTFQQSGTLFHTDSWPEEFRDAYAATYKNYGWMAPDYRLKQAQVTAARIDHLIQTGE